MEELKTKDDLLKKLRSYAETPDDYVSRFKTKIKEKLLLCPELLYALNYKDYETELFDEKGNINVNGEWDIYFGTCIRPYIPFIEEVQDSANNFLCYEVSFNEGPRYNKTECYMNITFVALCSTQQKQITDDLTGLSRHDLIASIIREQFNWSNIFGTQCHMVANQSRITDSKFLTRTIIFECTLLNSIVNTQYGDKPRIVNNRVRI